MKALRSKYYRATQHCPKTMKIIMSCLPATAIPSFTSPKDWGIAVAGRQDIMILEALYIKPQRRWRCIGW